MSSGVDRMVSSIEVKSLQFRTDLPRLVLGMAYARISGFPAMYPTAPLVLRDTETARPTGDHVVRVRTRLGGICGSDLHMLKVEVSRQSSVVATRRDSLGAVTYPGHEAMGDVVAVGPAVRRVEVGQRVVLVPGVFCSVFDGDEPCEFCRQGHIALCRRRAERPPFHVGGGWSEEFVRHESQLFPLPDEIDDETAVLIEPAGCSLHAILRRPPRDGDRVLILGTGMIGLGMISALRAIGVRVRIVALARHAFQAAAARSLGADAAVGHEGGDVYEALAATLDTRVQGRQKDNRYLVDGFDTVYDCVGSARSLHDAIRWCRPRGTVLLEGIDMYPGVLDRTQLWRRELEIVGTSGQGLDEWEGQRRNTFEWVIAWLREGRLSLEGLLSHRFPQRDYKDAIRTAIAKRKTGAIRVALDFRE
jgi:threonine dehydrogenase-like Zn-dependent dehydrogenase